MCRQHAWRSAKSRGPGSLTTGATLATATAHLVRGAGDMSAPAKTRRVRRWLSQSGSDPPSPVVIVIPTVAPPGWSAFDVQRVDQLRRAATSTDAPCPFKTQDSHRLAWRAGSYRSGTAF